MPLLGIDARLRIQREFAAPRERVFAAFITPRLIQTWLGGATTPSPCAEIDFQVGGRYCVAMKPPDRSPYCVVGTYQEIIVPEKLVFTSLLIGGDLSVEDTRVTIEFRERERFTEVTLYQERFRSPVARDVHHHAWHACFDRIDPPL